MIGEWHFESIEKAIRDNDHAMAGIHLDLIMDTYNDKALAYNTNFVEDGYLDRLERLYPNFIGDEEIKSNLERFIAYKRNE